MQVANYFGLVSRRKQALIQVSNLKLAWLQPNLFTYASRYLPIGIVFVFVIDAFEDILRKGLCTYETVNMYLFID